MTIKSTFLSLAFLAVCALGTTSANAQAIDTSGVATANVQAALSIGLISAPSWGRVTRPSSGTADYFLDMFEGYVGSENGFAFNDGQPGLYQLSGAPNAPISYSVNFGAFSTEGEGTGVTLLEAEVNGPESSGSGNLDEEGNMFLHIGGVISVASDAALGVHFSTITVTADYE